MDRWATAIAIFFLARSYLHRLLLYILHNGSMRYHALDIDRFDVPHCGKISWWISHIRNVYLDNYTVELTTSTRDLAVSWGVLCSFARATEYDRFCPYNALASSSKTRSCCLKLTRMRTLYSEKFGYLITRPFHRVQPLSR